MGSCCNKSRKKNKHEESDEVIEKDDRQAIVDIKFPDKGRKQPDIEEKKRKDI